MYKKDKIVLHHTGGSHNPYWTIDGWNAKQNKICTPWIIGGKANPPYKDISDGNMIAYFQDVYWSYHLGIKEKNHFISKKAIGIELCNYGELIRTKDDRFMTYVNTYVPSDQVCPCVFRGFNYYEAYSEKQLSTLKTLLINRAILHGIDLHEGLYKLLKTGSKTKAFELNQKALAGAPGLWSHTSYRLDKRDVSPQPNLIEMILSL